MELKNRVSFGKLFFTCYFVALFIYIIIGLQPARAATSDGNLSIPSIKLASATTTLKPNKSELETPDTIAGSYSQSTNKTLIIGHSTTVFQNLHNIQIGDVVFFNRHVFRVTAIETKLKSSIKMSQLLKAEETNTIVIMTCAGDLYENGDASHRLIITAVQI